MAWDLEYECSEVDEVTPPEEDEDELMDGSQDGASVVSALSFTNASFSSAGFDVTCDLELRGRLGIPQSDADFKAYSLLQLGWASEMNFQEIFDLLPHKTHNRNAVTEPDLRAASVHLGAFVHGGVSGLHRCTTSHPWTAVLCASLIKAVDPDLQFSTVALARNTVSTLHSDIHNAAGSSNLVVSLCTRTCEGGSLWIRDPKGDVSHPGVGVGRVLELSAAGIRFNPHTPHFTYPFVGTRLVAVAYHVRNIDRLSDFDQERLLQLGFLPNMSGRVD